MYVSLQFLFYFPCRSYSLTPSSPGISMQSETGPLWMKENACQEQTKQHAHSGAMGYIRPHLELIWNGVLKTKARCECYMATFSEFTEKSVISRYVFD